MLILIKLATWLVSPLGIVLGLASLGMAIRRIRAWAWSASLLFLVLFSNEYLAHLVLQPLELEAKATHASRKAEWSLLQKQPTTIVILGGGMSAALPPLREFPELHEASDRVWQGARLFHQGIAPRILVSGGKAPGLQSTAIKTEAESMQTFLLDLGVPNKAILLEPESRTTRENAERTLEILQPALGSEGSDWKRIALVTSASHMERSIRNYESVGFEVLPYPTDFQSGIDDKPLYRLLLPNAEALQQNQVTFKEWLAKWIGY